MMGENESKNRVKWVRVSGQLLIDTIRLDRKKLRDVLERTIVINNRLPKDAAIEDVIWDGERDLLSLLVRSEAFEEVRVGQEIPEFGPVEYATLPEKIPKPGGG